MQNLELYIHIPFCEKKCKYCDFVSFHATHDVVNNYIEKLLTEIESKSFLANNFKISSIYIGGGTPSFIEAKYIRFILESIYKSYNVNEDAEISIEVNPNSATMDKLKTYYDSGINRLSIGLQSANDDELKTLGRIHNYSDFLNAYNVAIHLGIKNINVDLINGIPGQSPESYRKTLKQVLMLNVKHISIYNLIIENGTAFKTMLDNNEIQLPLESDLLLMDKITKDLTSYYRLNRYEISNFAKSGFECRHNLGYWSDVPYIGFGLNSASYIDSKRYKNKTKINDYLSLDYKSYMLNKKIDEYYDEIAQVSINSHINEYMMLGFRKISGINTDDFYNTFNKKFEDLFGTALKIYQGMGLIRRVENNYFLTDEGLDVSNKILSDLLINE
ncbi:MAG: radical SAM family heme chaperone HemW [Lachnospiraceae bacterium]|nr:radical SAM family heme chaperone HemW [Lachnospiraceae bacterium]